MTESLKPAVEADFPGEGDAALAELMSYRDGAEDEDSDRVRRAVLALAGGDMGRLRHFMDRARQDFRDVLMCAETPVGEDDPQTYVELRARIGLPPDPDHQ